MTAYHRPRAGAIALTILFTAGTAYVLLEDVIRHGAEFSTAHVQTVLALIGTIAAGHLFWPEAKARRFGSAVGCALLFAAGTLYIGTASGARNATALQNKAASAANINEQRAAAKAKVVQAETDLAEAKDKARQAAAAAASECATGKGKLCEGKTATRDAADRDVERASSHALLMQAKLDLVKPAEDPSGGYSHAAEVFAALPFVTAPASEIEHRLTLLIPFLLVAISEIGTLVFGSMALSWRRHHPSAMETAQTSFPAAGKSHAAFFSGEIPDPPKPGARSRTSQRRQTVENFVHAYRARHGRDPEPREVRHATGLPRATAHRYQRRIG